MVTGSDSTEDYEHQCFPDCKKKCNDAESCKNKHQRINVYENLSQTYSFFGGIEDVIEPYKPGNEHKTVFVIKKNSI